MATQDPPWRRKTRPCPFYSNGRCLFADSCNFLHNVKAKTSSEALAVSYTRHELIPESPTSSPPPKHTPPTVTFTSPRSPTRSPRLSGLLLALKDVIEPDETIPEPVEDEPSIEEYSSLTDGFSAFLDNYGHHAVRSTKDASVEQPQSQVNPDHDISTFVGEFSSFLDRYRSDSMDSELAEEEDEDSIFGISSSVFGSDVGSRSQSPQSNILPLPLTETNNESFGVPFPSTEVHSYVDSPPQSMIEADTRSPTRSAGFSSSPLQPDYTPPDLLSPVELPSSLRLPWLPDACPPLVNREDSIDSGYADSWTGPLPFVKSPPRHRQQESKASIVEILALPGVQVLEPPIGSFVIRTPSTEDRYLSYSADADVLVETGHDDEELEAQSEDEFTVTATVTRPVFVSASIISPHVQGSPTCSPQLLSVEGHSAHASTSESIISELPNIGSPDSDFHHSPSARTESTLRQAHLEPSPDPFPAPVSISPAVDSDPHLETIFDADAEASPGIVDSGRPEDQSYSYSYSGSWTQEGVTISDFPLPPPLIPPVSSTRPVQSTFTNPDPDLADIPPADNTIDDTIADTVRSAIPFPSSTPQESPLDLHVPEVDVEDNEDEDMSHPSFESYMESTPDDDDDDDDDEDNEISPDDTGFTSMSDSYVVEDQLLSELSNETESTSLNEDPLSGIFDGVYSQTPGKRNRNSIPQAESSPLSRTQSRSSSRSRSPPRVPSVQSKAIPKPPPDPPRASRASTPISAPILGTRVFTPPPTLGRGRAGTPVDLVQPLPSLCSPLVSSIRSRSSSAARSDYGSVKGKSPVRALTPDSAGQVIEMPATGIGKVPFGFRGSFALGRVPSASSRMIPSSRTRPHIVTDLPPSSVPETPPDSSQYPPPSASSSTSAASRLKPLRLSTILSASSPTPDSAFASASSSSSFPPHCPTSISSPFHLRNKPSTSSISVSSDYSLSNNRLLSSARSSLIPEHIRNTLIPAQEISPLLLAADHTHSAPPFSNLNPRRSLTPQTAPISYNSWRGSLYHRNISELQNYSRRTSSRLSEPVLSHGELDEEDEDEEETYDETIRRAVPHTAPTSRPSSVMQSPFHAIATPPPTLMFAIASDDVEEVRRVLARGDAGPNDQVGPQSALAFALTNDALSNKLEIVKALLAYGANPASLKNPETNPSRSGSALGHYGSDDAPSPIVSSPAGTVPPAMLAGMDPATRYYIARADASHTRQTSALIHRSFFRPLTKVRYDLIGQDRALEQLFRVLSMHSQQLSVAPIVVLLCGPSGHGKSLLARKFGSLLGVPTHTVNMTTLRSTHDLWQSYSMSPYEEPSNCTLAEFLKDNEGKRCVVVLDEIEKTEDEKVLWSLLMPWELGRCSFEAGSRHIDVRNVIWLGTSNIGHDLVFEHHASGSHDDTLISREEYVELIGMLRPRVSERLGASLLSRVTAVLPFVPFLQNEKMAIAAEALYSLAGEMAREMSPTDVESMARKSLADYIPSEGARSLYRAVSSQLVDAI